MFTEAVSQGFRAWSNSPVLTERKHAEYRVFGSKASQI